MEFATMSRFRTVARAVFATLIALLPACTRPVPVEQLPSVPATLAEAGKRLSHSHSAAELTALATRGDRLLATLNASERDALARGHIRFRVDRPVVVYVAAHAEAVPFWLADQHFNRTDISLRNADGPFVVFRNEFGPGWVGLGVNGLDRSPPAHYSVFVRPTDGGPSVGLTNISPDSYRTTPARPGASPYADAHRPFERLPDELASAGSTLLQTALGDRHAALLLKGRAWKTHVPSSARPDQIVISFGAEADKSVTWTWRTGPGVSASAARFAPAAPGTTEPADQKAVRVVTGDSHLLTCDTVLNDAATYRHRVAVRDLEHNTLYAYSVGDGTALGWSPWQTVRTAPAEGSDFTFLYVGDAQTGFEAWGRLMQSALARHPEAGFLLMAGDLVDRGNERTNWDHFFLRARSVFDRLPMMPAVGNHEYLDQGPRLYRAFFSLPPNGPPGFESNLVYAFTYGNALFAVLDSTAAIADPESARKQAEWLDEQLSRSQAAWTFVMFHHPVYASHPTREQPGLRDAWVPVFDKHHVSMALQGHDHAYLRTYPLRAGRRTEPDEPGTVYVVSVSGDKFYDQDPRGVAAQGLTHRSTYQLINVRGDRLFYKSIDADGREVDSLVISQPDRSAPGRVANKGQEPRSLLLHDHPRVE
jgi:acid phosphatase type 7